MGRPWDQCLYLREVAPARTCPRASNSVSGELESGHIWSDDRVNLRDVCDSFGLYHQAQGEYEKAIEEFEQARAIAVELGDRQGEAMACNNMGMSYRALKQYDKAIELLENCLAIDEELGDKRGQAITCRNLGVCLSWHGQHDRAVVWLKQAWSEFQELGDEEDLSLIHI